MNVQQSLIDQLEGVLASRDISERAEVLHRVTDLFIHGSGKFSADQIDLFDEVMMPADRRTSSSRPEWRSEAGSPGCPMRPAALSASWHSTTASEVAAPVLTHSIRLDEATLVENARTQEPGTSACDRVSRIRSRGRD